MFSCNSLRERITNCKTVQALMQCSCLLLQVFATYPNEDYDRRNEDVDPMAASAEYELEKRVERLDLFPVELEKGTEHYKVTVTVTAHVYSIC